MKILIFYERDCGGETIATQNIISFLPSFNHSEVVSYCLDPLTRTGFFDYYSWYFLNSFKVMLKIFQHRDVQWIYTTTFYAGISALILKWFFHYKICFHYHGDRIPPQVKCSNIFRYATQSSKHFFAKFQHQCLYKGVNLVVIPTRESLKNIEISSYLEKKVFIIPNGVNLNKFHALSKYTVKTLMKKLKFKKGSIIISYLGRLEQRKHIIELVDAIKLLNSTYPIYSLLIVHPKIVRVEEFVYKKKLLSLIQKHKLIKHIKFIVNPKYIVGIYAISELIVLPSERENLPLTMLESWAMKRIFIGTTKFTSHDQRVLINKITPNDIAKKIVYVRKLPQIEKVKIIKAQNSNIGQYDWHHSVGKLYALLNSK